uniref:Uncharacterized protein n=1 Tax=Cannabis sativa TaxID=3483 RepID=A0A803PBG7_CANSA
MRALLGHQGVLEDLDERAFKSIEDKKERYTVKIDDRALKVTKGSLVIRKEKLNNGICYLEGNLVTISVALAIDKSIGNSTKIWHLKLGHDGNSRGNDVTEEEQNQVVVRKLAGKRIVICKRILREKKGNFEDGTKCIKERLVAKGFTQQE